MTTTPDVSASERHERLLALTRGGALAGSRLGVKTTYSIEPTRTFRAPGFDWEHEVRVALPPSYAHSSVDYPVLWVTDNNLEGVVPIAESLALSGEAPELIVVAVGADRSISPAEFQARRCFDFTLDEDPHFGGPNGDYIRRLGPDVFGGSTKFGGGRRFLDFLVDDLRTALSSEYRMQDDHGLVGGSGGGMFVGLALFARPAAFTRYICGSPSLYIGNFSLFDLEDEHAATHDDLPVHVFFGAGDGELMEGGVVTACGCVSSMALLVERLTLRAYPSLRMTARIFPGETHATIGPFFVRHGIKSVWAEKAAKP